MMEVKVSIKEFVRTWENVDKVIFKCVGTASYNLPDWERRFLDAGYCSAKITFSYDKWTAINAWCRRVFGQDHYAWYDSVFWFESQQDAALFLLTWS